MAMAAGAARDVYETQLARVETPRPRVLLLPDDDATERGAKARAVAQIRPRLLHYVENGQLMCVVRSQADICGIARVSGTQILVTTADGSIWHICLPSARLGIRPIMLEVTPRKHESGVAVRRVATVPGAQLVEYIATVDALVVTSLIMPTTIIYGVFSTGDQRALELDALEGEQTTSLLVLRLDQLDGKFLNAMCLDTPPSSSSTVVILQGDYDGYVRFAVVDIEMQRILRSADLIHVEERVHQVMPIRFSNSAAVNALLIIGAQSAIAVVTATADESARLLTASPSLGIGQLDVDLFMSDIVGTNHSDVVILNSAISVASVPRDCMYVSADQDASSGFVSILTYSGRVLLLSACSITGRDEATVRTSQSLPSGSSVKSLLHEIAKISDESRRLRDASNSADYLLRGLDSALQFLRLVAVKGVDQLLRLNLRLELQSSGWCTQFKQLRLCFALRGATDEAQNVLANRLVHDMWRIQLAITTGSGTISSYSLRLVECLQQERVILLDKSLLPSQLDSVVHIACHLVFSAEASEEFLPKKNPALASISVPVVEDQCIHLVQLSQPTKDYPQNAVAVREQFCQDQQLVAYGQISGLHGPAWWNTIQQDGLDRQDPDLTISPSLPLRFVFHAERTDTRGNDEGEVLAILKQLMNIRDQGHLSSWKQSLRNASGKWWVGMRTYSGNLIVLRFVVGPNSREDERDEDYNDDEDGCQSKAHSTVDVTVYASSVADLSAMRALFIATCTKTSHARSAVLDADRASLALTTLRGEVASLMAVVEDVKRKASVAGLIGDVSGNVDLCQQELLQLLQRAATAEIRTLEVYWKSREVLNHHIAF